MISPKDFILSSTRYLVSASEPITGFSLTMLEHLLSTLFNPEEGRTGDALTSTTPLSSDFSPTACAQWFDDLCHLKEGVMTPADILAFCDTIQKSPNDLVFLVLAYKMGVKSCGSISQAEWIRGMSELEIDSSQKLLMQWDHLRSLLDEPEMERILYRFSYDYIRDRDQDGNGLDVQSGSELVRMFLETKWKYCQAFQRFLTLTKVKAFTRDQFMNVIEFSRDVTSFEDYDDSGAWPVLLDDFVAHYTSNLHLYLIEPKSDVTRSKRPFSSAFDPADL